MQTVPIPWGKCLWLHPWHFLGFTQALLFPVGYNRPYIPLGRDISYTYTYKLHTSFSTNAIAPKISLFHSYDD